MTEGKYHANIFNSLPLPSLLLLADAPQFTIVEVNPVYLTAFNTQKTALIGKGIFEIFPAHTQNGIPSGLSGLHESLLAAINTCKPHSMPAQWYDIPVKGTGKSEVKYWVPENIPVLDESNKVRYIIHSIQDTAEKQMSLLINNTYEIFILLNKELQIISFNKLSHHIFKTYFGFEVKKGECILDYTQPARKASLQELYNLVLAGFDQESVIDTPARNGTTRTFSIKYTPTKDNNDQIIGVFVTATDITEEKQLQNRQKELFDQLMKRNLFIETVIQNIPIGIAVNKIDTGAATLVNKRFSETYGWDEKDLTDIHSFFQKVYPDKAYRKEISERVMSGIQSGDPEQMNWNGIRITTNKGEERIVNARNIPLAEQNLMISTVIDVTEATRQAAEIYRIKTNQEALINGTEDAIWSVDSNYCIITANRAYLELIKMATSKIPVEGDSVLVEAFGEELNKKWKAYYKRALKGERFSIHEQVYNPLKQRMEYALISFNPMLTSGGAVFGVACYSKDITEDTLNLQALEDAKEELNKIMDSSLDIICTIDEDGNFIKANAASEKIWGYLPQELIGKPYMQFVCPEDHAKTIAAASDIMKGIEMTNFENRYIQKHGGVIPMVWSARWDRKEKIMYCVARDATEKLNNESALIESEKKYKYLFENNPQPMVIWDFETLYIIDCNEEALMKYGYTKDEFLQLTIKDIRPEEDISLIEEVVKTEEIYGGIHKKVWRHKKKNGEIMFMNVDGHLVDYKGRRASLVMLNDITEKLKAEEELKQSEAFLKEAQRLAKLGNWNFDFTNDKLTWSDELYRVFGTAKETFHPTHGSFIVLVDEEYREFVRQTSSNTQKTGDPYTIQYHITTPAGEKRVIEEYGYGEKDPDGNIIRIFGTAQDITERKLLETKQKEILEQQSLFVSIVNSSDDAIISKTLDGIITSWNKGAEKVFGYTKEEAVHKHISLIIPELLMDEEVYIIERIKKGVPIEHYETERLKKDGSFINVSLTISPILDVSGNVIGASKIARDITQSKKTEGLIKESEIKYRSLVESSMDAILLTVKDGVILSANNAACKMFQMTEAEICKIGRGGIIDITDPRLPLLVEERTRSGKAKGEITLIRKGGTRFSGEISSVVFTDAKGEERTSMIIRDITELKKAEKEIIESNQRYQYVTKATSDAIWDWDLVNETVYWGEGFQTIFGYAVKEIKSDVSSWTDHIHPEDIERVMKGIYTLIEGNETNWEEEYRYLKTDQTYAFVIDKGFVIRDTNGKATRMVGAMHDITKQKNEEHHLKLLESVITNANDAILITEAEPLAFPGPRIVYVNEAFTKMTGYTSEEVIGKTPRILQGPKSDRKELKRLSNSLKKWQPCEITTVNYKKNGEEFWINFSVSPIADANGWFTHWISIERDVTEQKLIELKLKELNKNLEEHAKELLRSNAELEQFAYVASHDLQEPLRMITSFLAQLDKKYGTLIDEKGKQYIDFAVDGAKRMRQIILDLLEFSRVGRTEEIKEKINLYELITEIEGLYRKQIKEKAAVIELGALPFLFSYKTPLRQVFQNLISNALKYTRHGVPAKIQITAQELETHWQFSITDNGIGIEEEYFEKIFIIFQRLHNKDDFSGTGIGLAITKKIIDGMGGKIWVESEEGKGSSFNFTLQK